VPMLHGGLAKLAEECGEVVQVVGKRLQYPLGDHPDGQGDLRARLEDEIADAMAACEFVVEKQGMNSQRIRERVARKLALFRAWDREP